MAFTARGLRLAKVFEKYHKENPVYFDTMNIINKMKITEINDETFKAKFTVAPSMCNGYGIIHGGYIASAMDVLCLYGIVAKTGGKMSITTNVNVVFINAAKIGETITAVAKSVRGGSSPVMEALMYTECGSESHCLFQGGKRGVSEKGL